MSAKTGWVKINVEQNGLFSYRRTRNGKRVGKPMWACRYRGPGQTNRRSGPKMGFASQAEASAWREKIEARTGGSSKAQKFGVEIEAYRAARIAAGNKESSYQYIDLWKQAFAGKKITDVDTDQVEAQLDRWQQARQWSNGTRNRCLAQLSGFFTYCYKRRWITDHPTDHGRVGKVKEAGSRKRWLRMSEVETIIGHCDKWLEHITRFAVTTGMRMSEICDLTKADFQEVRRAGSDQPIRAAVVTDTKNGSTLVYPLHGWPLEHIQQRVEGLRFPGERLFPGPDGGNAHSSIRRHLKSAVLASGLEWGKYKLGDDGKPVRDESGQKILNDRGITFHSLRHSMASLALNSGIPIEAIQELGNWRTRRIVETYAHVADETLIAAAAKMADMVQPQRRKRFTKSKRAPKVQSI